MLLLDEDDVGFVLMHSVIYNSMGYTLKRKMHLFHVILRVELFCHLTIQTLTYTGFIIFKKIDSDKVTFCLRMRSFLIMNRFQVGVCQYSTVQYSTTIEEEG